MEINYNEPVLTGIVLNIQRSPDTLYIRSLIYYLVDCVEVPVDLTNWKIEIPIKDSFGNLILLLSSENEYITIISGENKSPNFIINTPNAVILSDFENGEYLASFITTDAAGIVKTRWIGVAKIS